MPENKNELREMSIEFALAVSDICDEISGCRSYVEQVVRSSSSIGANLHEAKYAQSKADFIHKLEIFNNQYSTFIQCPIQEYTLIIEILIIKWLLCIDY